MPQLLCSPRRALILAVLALAPALCAGAFPNNFASLVKNRFPKWDADHNGVLSPEEVDRLAVDPSWKGDDAAAIAAIKISMRTKKDPIDSLALADLDTFATKTLRQEDDVAPTDSRVPKKPDTLQKRFEYASRAIRNVKREVFADPTPDLDKFHQGRIGDCFFVSMVGAMVERDPQSVKKMISTGPGSDYTVTFGTKQSVVIPALTDTEYALVSTTGDEGIWLPLIEKAYGSLRMDARPDDKRVQELTDSIARGGNIGNSIQVLTGHRADRVNLNLDKNPAAKDPAKFLESLRSKIGAAVEAKRLIGAGTDKEPGVPGISPNHAYAVFGYDSRTDTLHVWNPHGNTFHPKGPTGLTNGYPTKGGRFDISMVDFAKTFRGLYIETDQPFDAAAKPARQGAARK